MSQGVPLPSTCTKHTKKFISRIPEEGPAMHEFESSRCSETRFPLELMNIIIEYLSFDLPSLASICLVSRGLQHYAEARLYSRIRVDAQFEGTRNTQIGKEEAEKVFATIISNPRLGHFVKTVEVEGGNKGGLGLDFLDPALRLMPNLKFLVLRGGYVESEILSGSGPFELEGFGFYSSSRYKELDKELVDFLVKQPNITQLGLVVDRKTVEALPKTACPNVTEFAGNRAGIELFVPTRSTIRYLGWQQGGEDYDNISIHGVPDPIDKPSSRKLIDALSAVPFLSIGPIFTLRPRGPTSRLTPHLVGLQVLSLTEGMYPEDLSEVTNLPSLQLLCITSSMDYVVKLPWTLLNGYHVNRWFELSRSLRIVAYRTLNVVKHPPLNVQRLDYEKWERGVNGSVLVSLAHIEDIIQEIVGCKAHPGVAAGRGMGIAF